MLAASPCIEFVILFRSSNFDSPVFLLDLADALPLDAGGWVSSDRESSCSSERTAPSICPSWLVNLVQRGETKSPTLDGVDAYCAIATRSRNGNVDASCRTPVGADVGSTSSQSFSSSSCLGDEEELPASALDSTVANLIKFRQMFMAVTRTNESFSSAEQNSSARAYSGKFTPRHCSRSMS